MAIDRVIAPRAAEHDAGQLSPGVDAELAVDLAEVELDRLGADEERGSRFLVGCAVGDGERDLQLVRGQELLGQALRLFALGPAASPSGRGELCLRSRSPGLR